MIGMCGYGEWRCGVGVRGGGAVQDVHHMERDGGRNVM